MDVELLTIQQSTWSRRSWYQGVFWLQRGCSRALVQIFVAGRGDFGEHSRAPALLNTPLVQSVFKCVKIICWGGNVNFWFHLQFYGNANNCTILFLNWKFAWFLDNVLFFSYTHNKPVRRLHTYTLVFKGQEDSFIKYN